MKKKINTHNIVIIGVIVVLILFWGFLGYGYVHKEDARITFENGNGDKIKILAEIADSSEERQTGLMYRKYLGQKKGMIFVFPAESNYSFWMKNTLIPLDMIFVDGDFEIVDIIENVPPCKNNPCPNYTPNGDALYVIEVNADFSEKYGINLGDKIEVQFGESNGLYN